MKLLYKLGILFLLLSLISCAKNKEEISQIKEIDQEAELINTYGEGIKALEQRDYFFAAKKFLESELLFPQSMWAPKSLLMASYSQYMNDNYAAAKDNLERFIKIYPENKNRVYAEYLLGMCYYETIENETLDQAPLINSKKQFQIVVKNYPETDFASDANFKLKLINDILGAKEMYIGRHYIKAKKWVAAINRFKKVLEDYDTTIYSEEAIHRLVEIYYHLGLEEESKKYTNLLGYNYLSSEWYKKSYVIFNKNYKIDYQKKEKSKVIKIFDKLFE
jgi:outer membrane protein assembly factor BamD